MKNNKKILIAGACSIAALGLGMGSLAFFSDTDTKTLNAKVGSVAVDITDYKIAHSGDTDNINPGDNDFSTGNQTRSGNDHELSFQVENTGTKSVMTRTIITVKGTSVDGEELKYEDFFKECDVPPLFVWDEEEGKLYENPDYNPNQIFIADESPLYTAVKEEILAPGYDSTNTTIKPYRENETMNTSVYMGERYAYNGTACKLILKEKVEDDGLGENDSSKFATEYYKGIRSAKTSDGYLAFIITGNQRDVLNGVGENAEIEEGIETNILKKVFDIGMLKDVEEDDILMGADLDFEIEVQAIQFRNTNAADFDTIFPGMWYVERNTNTENTSTEENTSTFETSASEITSSENTSTNTSSVGGGGSLDLGDLTIDETISVSDDNIIEDDEMPNTENQ